MTNTDAKFLALAARANAIERRRVIRENVLRVVIALAASAATAAVMMRL